MTKYDSMDAEALSACLSDVKAKLDDWKSRDLSLDLTRGKPSQQQLDLSTDMLGVINDRESCFSEAGLDCRNYGILDGLPETKRLFSELLSIPESRIIIAGNSSLNMMYDTIARAMLFGVYGGKEPWCRQGNIKFLCPSPGYDRHFAICKTMGIEMIPVEMTPDGPDMDAVERLVETDISVKGIWCVPKFSNPEGYTYSDETVERFAALKPAAEDFRIFWDNAYAVHELYDEQVHLADIFALAEKYGTEDNIFYFASTSKITFPGSGVACFACSEANMAYMKKLISAQTISFDKINQLRHALFLKDRATALAHMKKHAEFLKPKFDIVLEYLEREIKPLDIGRWHTPKGGYFVSFFTIPGCAKRTNQLAKEAGVVMTAAGATYPYGIDPEDSNLRIAPSYPPVEELKEAMSVFCTCVKLAAAEKLLAEK